VEERLPGGNAGGAVLVDGTVRRPTGAWTPAVHDLLRHLEQRGFTGAPRVLGIDEQHREILTYLPGEIPQLRPRFFDGFHRCVHAMAAAGNNVIVEHVVELAQWRAELDVLLHGFDVFWVAVHCDLAEIDRREVARGDRTPGEGRAHVELDRIHDHGHHDLHIDTTVGVTDALVQIVIDEWGAPRRPGPETGL
jgi:chloramphenicol 3-O-phosphotransferase